MTAAASVAPTARVILAGPEPLLETIEWRPASKAPDADITVLLAFDPALQMDVELGWHDEGGWHYAESGGDCPVAPKWWADVPAGPQC